MSLLPSSNSFMSLQQRMDYMLRPRAGDISGNIEALPSARQWPLEGWF